MNTYSVIIIGAGNRGSNYSRKLDVLRDRYKVVAVAEPVEGRRNYVKELYDLPDDMCFTSWQDILSRPKLADIAIVATMDNEHYEPAMKAIELGYNLLLEKPVAPTPQQCADIANAAKAKGVEVLVCHVLRYTPFYKRVKELVLDGTIGDIVSVVAVEAVGNVHQSHSYVRGNWHSEADTTPMLLAKSCHDLDIIQWLVDKPCTKVSSFGSLTYFTEKNAPEGSPVRCIDGGCPVEDTCPYNCRKLYYDDKDNAWFRKASTRGIAKEYMPTDEEVMTALKTTDFGLCVFHANNDVVDHQVVNMEFEGGITASFTMNAFNKGGRYIRLFGTKGELFANMSDTEITVYTFEDKQTHTYTVAETEESILGGHGGGDQGIVSELHEYLSGNYTGWCAANIQISVQNHMIGFAAEKARHNNTVEDVQKYAAEYGM
ncbi:MAG: Gfo/Idh/MocA family oxidoreductase [Oscillospiraceae bacterium]|nr:Gfo/Idh/MocA family oxidoreductase [Oscillospiraceae bacterium]